MTARLVLFKCLTLLFMLAIGVEGYAQAPQGFSYQAVIRNSSGQPIANQNVKVHILLTDNLATTTYYEEQHTTLTTNAQGVANLTIGEGSLKQGTLDAVPWQNGEVYIKVEVDPTGTSGYQAMGQPAKLYSVPYALFAENAKEVVSQPTALDDDPIFVVKNKAGQIVFAVYQTGVRVYVEESPTIKGARGGFAVGGLSQTKLGSNEYFRITSDSARIYVKNPVNKGARGGFAVGGLSQTKGSADNFMQLTPENYFIGHESGKSITTGLYNSFLGYQTGVSSTVASNNVILGYLAGYSNIEGNSNVFIGNLSGYNNQKGSRNTFIGNKAGYSNWSGASGYRNVFIGDSTGYNNLSGYDNVFMGSQVGSANMGGHSNVFLGYRAGYSNWGGYSNVFIGKEAGYNASLGYDNVYIGYQTGYAGHGQYNVYIGHEAGLSNAGGSLNTFIGKSAGRSHTNGNYNVFLGLEAGFGNITGERNVFLGYSAGSQETGSDKLYISNSSTTTPLIWGDFNYSRIGIHRQATTNTLEVEGEASKTAGGSWAINSDRRIKTDIKDIDNPFETILKLHPVKFKYTDEWMRLHPSIKNQYYYNFIAQEFQEVFPEAVKGSGEYLNGDSKEILQVDTYNAQIVTIKAVQDLILENQKQQKEIEALKAEIEAIKALLKK